MVFVEFCLRVVTTLGAGLISTALGLLKPFGLRALRLSSIAAQSIEPSIGD